MEIKRQQELVEGFHYDMRKPDAEVETQLRVGFLQSNQKMRTILLKIQLLRHAWSFV